MSEVETVLLVDSGTHPLTKVGEVHFFALFSASLLHDLLKVCEVEVNETAVLPYQVRWLHITIMVFVHFNESPSNGGVIVFKPESKRVFKF